MQDPSGVTSSAQVSIEIADDPGRPVLAADSAFVLEDGSVVINVLQNDTSVSALNPGVLLVTKPPANGTAVLVGGSVRYTPAANWNGTDSFVYYTCDADDFCATSAVTITVMSVNDAPQTPSLVQTSRCLLDRPRGPSGVGQQALRQDLPMKRRSRLSPQLEFRILRCSQSSLSSTVLGTCRSRRLQPLVAQPP